MNKNILFLVSRFLDGGIDTVLVQYVNALARYTSHRITIAIGMDYKDAEVFTNRIDNSVNIIHIIENDLLTFHKRKKHHNKKNILLGAFDELLLNPVRRIATRRAIQSLAQTHDVVIDFDCYFSAFMDIIPDGKPKITFSHFSLKQNVSPRRSRRMAHKLEHYDKVIVICRQMMDEAIELYPHLSGKLVCIYNPCNPETLAEKAAEVVNNPLMNNRFILAIERLEESQKDITTLIRAYSLLDMPDRPHLYIIGEGASRPQLETLIEQLGAGDNVHLLGFKANPYPWIKHAEMVVHSSKFEGFGMVLVEALLLGKLVISTDCPVGPREVLNDGRAGILTPVGDAQALSIAMNTALSDEQLRTSIIAAARKHSNLFYPETVIEQLQKLF